MPHIKLADNVPSIVSAFMSYPKSGKILKQLAQTLLIEDSPTFSKFERELVAIMAKIIAEKGYDRG